jgi:hypothetical protein
MIAVAKDGRVKRFRVLETHPVENPSIEDVCFHHFYSRSAVIVNPNEFFALRKQRFESRAPRRGGRVLLASNVGRSGRRAPARN